MLTRFICADSPGFCAFHDESTIDGEGSTLHNLTLWLRAGCRKSPGHSGATAWFSGALRHRKRRLPLPYQWIAV